MFSTLWLSRRLNCGRPQKLTKVVTWLIVHCWWLSIICYDLGAGAYTPCVRRTPWETEHDWRVIFQIVRLRENHKKSRKLIVYFPARRCALFQVLDCSCMRRDICTNCFSGCERRCSRSEWILFSCLFLAKNPGCATFQAHTYYSARKLEPPRHSHRAANNFCNYDLRCSRAECILLACCFDLSTLGVRLLYSRRTPGLDCSYSKRHSCRLFFHL